MSTKQPPRSADQILKDKAEAAEKKKGGRPPGRKNNATLAKEEAERQAAAASGGPPTPSLDEQLNALKAEYPPAPAAPPSTEQTKQPPTPEVPGGAPAPAPVADAPPFTISGHLALIVVDSLFPSALAWLLNRYGGYNGTVKKSDLQLTEREVKDLEPIADEVAKRIMADPLIVLVIALVGCYAGKIPPKPEGKKSKG